MARKCSLCEESDAFARLRSLCARFKRLMRCSLSLQSLSSLEYCLVLSTSLPATIRSGCARCGDEPIHSSAIGAEIRFVPPMKRRWRCNTHRRHPRACGNPVRRGFSVQSLLPLEYWIVRPSAQARTRRTMAIEYGFAISQRVALEVCWILLALQSEGAGKTGCLLHPRSRVRFCANKNGTRAYRAAGAFRPSLRNGFTAYFVLSPENGSFASVAPRHNP